MAFKVFENIKKKLDPHFNYDKELVDAVAEKYKFDEKQKARFDNFCQNLDQATHVDYEYGKKSHKEQQEILNEVIAGIQKNPEIDKFYFKGRGGYKLPSANGQTITLKENPGVYEELSVTAAAMFPENKKGQPVEKQ